MNPKSHTVIIKLGENPVGKLIDTFISYGQVGTQLGHKGDYVVSRKDCFTLCELVLRHFILNYGHDDLLPPPGAGTEQILKNYITGEMNFFTDFKTPQP